MNTVTRTRLLTAAFTLSLCGLGLTATISRQVAQTTTQPTCKFPQPTCLVGTAECCPDSTWACPNGVTGASQCRQKKCPTPARTGTPWQNQANPLDVDGNGTVDHADAQAVTDKLRAIAGSRGSNVLPATNPNTNTYYNVQGTRNWRKQETIDQLDAIIIESYLRCVGIPKPQPTPPTTCATGYQCERRIDNNQCLYAFINCAPGSKPEYNGTCGTAACTGRCARCVPDAASGATLTIAVKAIGSMDFAVRNEKNVNLLRFEGRAMNQDVRFTHSAFYASSGSLLNAHNYTLWADTDYNGIVETKLQTGVTALNDLVTFNRLSGSGFLIRKDHSVIFEVHADIASSVTGNPFQIAFATTLADYVQAHNGQYGPPLSGIRTNGSCPSLRCDITVTTVPSKAYWIVNQGDLFVTLDSTPTPTRQLLGGTLSEPVLRLQFRAQYEDIDVTALRLYSGSASTASSIDRYELSLDGAATPFAVATVAGCGTSTVAPGTFCAHMGSGQLLVPENESKDVLVRARVKTDEQGATSHQRILLMVTPFPVSYPRVTMVPVEARGRASSNMLASNSGNGMFGEGVVFIGTDSISADRPIKSNMHVTALSKITSITNANPDADGTSIPTGVSSIGQFKFTAAQNMNTMNGLNKASLHKIVFTVVAPNVSLNALDFRMYNKADSTMKVLCTNTGNGSVPNTYIVACSNLRTSGIDADLESGESSTFVLEANILNPKVSSSLPSSLQVSLTNFATPTAFNGNIQWMDVDASAFIPTFQWIESPDTIVNSTLYRS